MSDKMHGRGEMLVLHIRMYHQAGVLLSVTGVHSASKLGEVGPMNQAGPPAANSLNRVHVGHDKGEEP